MTSVTSTTAYPVAGVLLAAGSSRRFGVENKLLAEVGGVPLVRRVALALAASPIAGLIVVTGPDAASVGAALAGIDVRLVHNPDHATGMGGSIAAGIRALPEGMAGALVCPGDMPGLERRVVDLIVARFEASGGEGIVYPALADGSQRNPVLWPRRLFPRLARLAGEGGAKPLLAEHKSECIAVEVPDEETFTDIDTAEELARYRSRLERG